MSLHLSVAAVPACRLRHPLWRSNLTDPGRSYRDKPLALYVFTKEKATETLLLANTTAGGVTVNDTLFHIGGMSADAPADGLGRV